MSAAIFENEKEGHKSLVIIGSKGMAWRFNPNQIPGLKNMLPIVVDLAKISSSNI